MHPVLFKIGPITIYTYGVFVFLGVAISYSLSLRDAAREGIDKERLSSVLFWSIVTGFITARLLYCVVEWHYFLSDPWTMLFGRSGFVFFGGLVGASSTFIILLRRYHLPLLRTMDCVARYLPLGHAFGRVGCFFFGCCYGRPTQRWFGLYFPPGSPAGILHTKLVPTQLISAALLLLLFFILSAIRKKQKYEGQIVIWYLYGYSVMRFFVEFLRFDPRGQVGIFSTSQVIALVIILTVWFLKKFLTRLQDKKNLS